MNYESKFVKGENSDLVISVRGQTPTVIDLSDVDNSKSKQEVLDQISEKINEHKDVTNVSSSVVNGKLVFKTNSKEQIVISGNAANSIGIGNSLDMTLDVKTEKMVNVLTLMIQIIKKLNLRLMVKLLNMILDLKKIKMDIKVDKI